jgi:anti-sigma factor RsiW
VSQADRAVEQAAPVVRSQDGARRGATVAELTHGVIRGQLSEYLDGSLGSTDRERVDRHLDECSSCYAYLNTLRATIDLAGGLPVKPAPSRVKDSILRQARTEL